ncbi:MAG: glycine cleavage system protein GcvH [Verrucomicrobiota bacterium]
MKRISQDHEWVELKDGVATIGVTAHAAEELGDVTFVELPDVGLTVAQGDSLGVVESVKAASDIYSPVGGTVSEINGKLDDTPELINSDAETDGWLCKLSEVVESDMDSLMTEEEYAEFIGEDA